MAITLTPSDKTVKVPYGFKGEKITIAEMVETKEFTSLEPLFAERILNMIRDNPSIGILKGGGGRSPEDVRKYFYANYTKINNAPDYENDPAKYEQIKAGKLKWNPEDGEWYKMTGRGVYAVPGGSWHEGGYAVDLTGNVPLAGKVSKNYQIEQILGQGETHHFQPLGVPTSKRMFLELKKNYGIDAIKTPLPPDILLYINKEIASNVPRHPERIKKVLDAAIAKFKSSSPGSDDQTVFKDFLTYAGQSASAMKVDWSQVREITPTTVAKAVAPNTTTTTTTVKPKATTTTSTLPDLPEPGKKETPEARAVRLRADWVMERSDALVNTGMQRKAADKQALKDVTTQFGKQKASVIPSPATTTTATTVKPTTTTTAPNSVVPLETMEAAAAAAAKNLGTPPTTTVAPATTAAPRTTTTMAPTTTTASPTTTAAPRRTTTTTVAPTTSTTVTPTTTTVAPGATATTDWIKKRAATYVVVLGLSPAAAKKKATEEANDTTRDAEATDPFDVLPSIDLEAPGAAKKQLAAMQKAKLDPATNRWSVPGYGLYSEQDYSDVLATLKANANNPAASAVDTTNPNPTNPGRQPKDYGNTKPAQAIEGDTYTNSKNVKFTFKGGKYVRTATLTGTGNTVDPEWKSIIQKEFGPLWDVYNMNPDVKKVLDDAVKGGYQNDEMKMEEKLKSTSWFRTTQQSVRQFVIQQSTDPATTESRILASIEDFKVNTGKQGFTLSDASLRKLASDSVKYGWTPQQKLNAIGSEAVAEAQLGGAQGMTDLRQSAVGRNLRAKAAAFFQKPSEEMIGSWTQQILLGQKDEKQFEETMRGSARTQFRSLQPALDRGEDVDTAMYAYKQQAESILGKTIDASQIDWTQDKWNKALNFQDTKTGEYRQMDLWEWNKYLRTLPEWQNTEEAKSAYGDLAISLARGFGKTA